MENPVTSVYKLPSKSIRAQHLQHFEIKTIKNKKRLKKARLHVFYELNLKYKKVFNIHRKLYILSAVQSEI